jgi:carboxyvinyl-carboxyphosphonate phosphorylmutase
MKRTTAERRAALRAVLTGSSMRIPASVFDPVSARIAADLGFPVAFLSGTLVSYARLGQPDLTLLTLDELAGQARQVARVADIPLLIDADHGYGGALNVRRTVEELELAGAAGLILEDTVLPARPDAPGALIPLAQAVGKFRATLEARSDPQFVIFARTALGPNADDAAARVAAYAATGVDGLLLTGVRGADHPAIKAAAGLPLMILPAVDVEPEPGPLEAAGVRLILKNGHEAFISAARAIRATYAALVKDGLSTPSTPMAAYKEMDGVVGGVEHRDWLARHSGAPPNNA